MKNKTWSIEKVWNKVADYEPRYKDRDYISASDIGKSHLDFYYKITNEPVTNEPEERVLRIFDSGVFYHHYFQWVFAF